MNTATIWAVAGLILIILDVVSATFFMLFLGFGALITGALVWAGALPDPTYQWIVFAVLSAASMLAFRKKLAETMGNRSENKYNEHEGQIVLVETDIPGSGTGRVIYRGSHWPAVSANGNAISAGTHAIITGTDGITLKVKSE